MPIQELAGAMIHTDDDGRLVDASDWTPAIAEALADRYGIGVLTDRHWRTLAQLREDAMRHGRVTVTDLAELRALFGDDALNLATTIAGLPRPVVETEESDP